MARGEKRERLVEAARTLVHQQGYHRTTLADVAGAAEVPLGNVYYYFRTKDALAEEVIAAHARQLRADFARYELDPDPRERLKALVRQGRAFGEELSRFGCPYGSLCQELDKDTDPLTEHAAGLLRRYLDWAEEQFRLLGKGATAAELAADLIAAQQGAYLLTNTFRSPEFLERRIASLEAWLDQV
jgi:AcrR family transcriptional regulator